MSISSALALVAAGAKGKTLDEIARSIAWNAGSNDRLAMAILEEAQRTANQCTKACSLKSANGIWLENDFIVNSSYQKFLETFAVEVAKVDFKRDSSGATKSINKWVEDQTNKKISQLFPEGVLNEMTRAALVNAMYFKGSWLVPFNKESTSPAPFFVTNNKKVEVKMMYHSGDFKYLYDMERACDLVQLEYEGGSFSMILVVPQEIEGLNRITSTFNLEQFLKWKNTLDSSPKENIDVFLPRFKVSQKINLKTSLQGLGINEMFSEKANLTGISEAGNLYVSSALHEAVIEVNEEGTEASAATGLGINFMSLPPQIRADKPFLFMVVSSKTNNIVFIGKVNDPSK